ncbi:hypothetical protein NEE01_21070 [Sphingomonas sp. MMSM24]|uniref:Uncharacterized protein n=1 Tax=Sphingomonas lycopersici TaxID=2951807 RepID=A0AA41ZB58_9SPHN|nr:hypothetical protein [Sphingomonas lycopersici]
MTVALHSVERSLQSRRIVRPAIASRTETFDVEGGVWRRQRIGQSKCGMRFL